MPEPVVIYAPTGRDAAVMEGILRSADIVCVAMNAPVLVSAVRSRAAGVALITEEALSPLMAADLLGALGEQPPWSDFPFVVLTGKGVPAATPSTMMRSLGHVTQLERPVHAVTLVRAVRAMLRARGRQRDAERYLADRAEAEGRLRELAATLERRVEERTSELTAANDRLFAEMIARIDANDRMNQLQAQLIYVSRVSAMGAMAAALAHELNQPLTAIMNYVRGGRRMLDTLDPPASEPILAALDAAVESARHAGELIRHLRDLVRTGDMKRSATDLAGLIRDALAIGLIDGALLGVRYALALDPGATTVLIDPIQIQQVLINLIRNAAEAMQGTGGGEILISSRRCGNKVEVSVADGGPGLSPTVLDTLFTPFKSTKAHGMGVGLSISRTIVEANEGSISGGNLPGGGAVFRFELPLALTPEAV